ncbi:MAG: Xaa-Pro peptidase family protein [Candidatus Aenigmatarchaeota archaeon]
MGMIKTKEEIKLLKKSAEISNSCIPLIESLLKKEKITEKEIASAIRRKIYSQGAELAFRTIVACGKRAARIHAKPRASNKIISGLGYVDFGASYKGYKTDVTVPFIKGKISKKEEKMVKAVIQAYNLAFKSLKVGLPCFQLFEKVDNFLRKQGFGMQHSLGHGVGLKIHELPTIGIPKEKLEKLNKKKKKKLEKLKKIRFQENMVFTIEPAVYVKGLGGCRLENTILLTKSEPVSITNSKLLIIKNQV